MASYGSDALQSKIAGLQGSPVNDTLQRLEQDCNCITAAVHFGGQGGRSPARAEQFVKCSPMS